MRTSAQRQLTIQPVEKLIRIVRGQKVMLDQDAARLYGVETMILNQAANRNLDRFPDDFIFRLSPAETKSIISQFVTSSKRKLKNQQLACTEQGIAVLKSVLRRWRAIQMNTPIMRAFVRMRELVETYKEFAARIEKLERGRESATSVIAVLIEDIDKLSRDIHWIKNLSQIGFVGSKE